MWRCGCCGGGARNKNKKAQRVGWAFRVSLRLLRMARATVTQRNVGGTVGARARSCPPPCRRRSAHRRRRSGRSSGRECSHAPAAGAIAMRPDRASAGPRLHAADDPAKPLERAGQPSRGTIRQSRAPCARGPSSLHGFRLRGDDDPAKPRALRAHGPGNLLWVPAFAGTMIRQSRARFARTGRIYRLRGGWTTGVTDTRMRRRFPGSSGRRERNLAPL